MNDPSSREALATWMRVVLVLAAAHNLLAGTAMIVFYHEAYKMLGLTKPDLNMPLQLVGILVLLFGVGYWFVFRSPVENRNLLLLGLWSKALGSTLGIYYVMAGKLPIMFLPILFFADIIYLVPFYMIWRRLRTVASMV